MVVPAPIKSTLKRTPFGGLEIPASIQKLMAGINQSIKYSFVLKSTVNDILSEDFSILEHIHKGFRYSLEMELITNIKTALINQIREDNSTKEYGDMLAYMAPLFLL